MPDPTKRFSSRAKNYTQYRPRYPHEVVETLRDECGLSQASAIADIGSGTGFLTELFLQNGNPVFAVEPNREMRESAEDLLQHYPGFHSVAGRAEATTLLDRCVDFVTAAQSFHWFEREATRREFLRILKPTGYLMIVWNEREMQTPFMIEYEKLLNRYVEGYGQLTHRHVYKTALTEFYGPGGFQTRTFSYRQELDFEGVKGRLLSSSYTPEAGNPSHEPMLARLAELFRTYETGGRVAIEYATRMYFGQLD